MFERVPERDPVRERIRTCVERGEIQPHFAEEMERTVRSVSGKMTEPCLVFPVCTDIHYAPDDTLLFDQMIENMRTFTQLVPCTGVWCLGDLSDGNLEQRILNDQLALIFDQLNSMNAPLFFAAGNHDTNAYKGGEPYSTEQLFAHYYARMGDAPVRRDSGSFGINYCMDYPEFRIRMISINAGNTEYKKPHYRYVANTVEWFRHTLYETPKGYAVFLMTHMSPIASQNWNSTVPDNADAVLDTILSWLSEEGNSLVTVMGHSHADYFYYSPFLTIAVNCQKGGDVRDFRITDAWKAAHPEEFGVCGAQHWARDTGTFREDSWDVMVIQPWNRRIHMIRFGAGEDRLFYY